MCMCSECLGGTVSLKDELYNYGPLCASQAFFYGTSASQPTKSEKNHPYLALQAEDFDLMVQE